MRPKLFLVRSAILVLSLTMPVAAAQAGPIISNAGDYWQTGLATVSVQVGGATSGFAVATAYHPAWEPSHVGTSGAAWISYADTGYDGLTLAPFAQGNTVPVMSVREEFTAMAGSFLTLTVWADDTSIVRLVNLSNPSSSVIIPHATWANSVCETYPVSCAPGNSGSYSHTFDANDAGNYELWFDTYQVGTGGNTHINPFGLMYEGNISSVPEPSSMMLFGTGLLGLAGILRRRNKK